MSDSSKNWSINSYTSNQWTVVAVADAQIKSMIIANNTDAAITVSLRVSNGPNTERAIVLPATAIAARTSQTMDTCQINLDRADQLQMQATAAGISILASGSDE